MDGMATMDPPPLVPTSGDPTDVMEAAVACARRGARGALATVVERHGSTPSTPGQKLFVGADGTCVGTVGGGAVERDVLVALSVMLAARDPRHESKSFALGPELGMCCGGRVEVVIEPIDAVTPCLVVGGGHVGTALAPMLARVGFVVTLVDAREAWGRENRLPGVRCVVGEFDDPECAIDRRGAVLVMTHDHGEDQRAIEWALSRGYAFVGGVGSRAKAKRTRDRLAAKGVSEADIARIRMPLGVDVGARLPDEIAVAIAAEMVGWRRRRDSDVSQTDRSPAERPTRS
jgi:xanthine dehydrogenase accessory factor